MARTRIKEEPVFQSWEEVDAALKEICENELAIEEIEGEMNKQIHGVKLSAAQEAKPHRDRIATLGKDIKAFVTEHRDELDGKTKTLNFGKTGFRLSTRLTLPQAKEKLAAIVRNLKRRGMDDCVAVTETVNREVLKKYPEDDIVRVGGAIKKEDIFWYEPDRAKLRPTE